MSDLSELFERDPLKLTSEDIDAIIKKMREHQAQFELGVPKGGKVVAPKKTKTSAAGADLLKQLGID